MAVSEDLQIVSLRPESVQPFWLFDGAGEKSLSGEVELLARRCRTVSPNALKQELYYEKRPHSTAGIPMDGQIWRRGKQMGSKSRKGKILTEKNVKEENMKKALQRFQPPKTKNVRIGPGYVISQTSHDVFAKIDTSHLTDPPKQVTYLGERRTSFKPGNEKFSADRQIIEDLRKRIDDLSAALEDKKVCHRLEMKQINDLHAKDCEDIKKEHEEHINAIELDNSEELKQIEDEHKRKIQEILAEALKENNELAREAKVAKAALETYKESMMKEVNAKWKENELEMKIEHERKTEKLLLVQRNDLIADKNKELDVVTKEHRRQIALIVESNKKEMDVLLRKFTATVADAERLKIIMAELEQVKSENEQMKGDLEKSRKFHRSATNELHDVKVKLQMYKDHFAEKVSEVDEQYSQKINDLMIDNSSLRQQYIRKCDELYQVRSERDVKQEDNLIAAKNAMQQVILSRARADVSLTALRDNDTSSGPPLETDRRMTRFPQTKQKRPTSAPSTDKETTVAVRASSKGYYTTPPEATIKHPRPFSSCFMPVSDIDESRLRAHSINDANHALKKVSLKQTPPLITVDKPKMNHPSRASSAKVRFLN